MASTTMTSDKGYRTTMSVTASLTGNTQGNKREVRANGVIDFVDSGYGSYAYAPVTYVLQINGTTVDTWAPTSVERTSYSRTGTLYVTAGQTISVRLYAYISWSGADFSYPPNPDNGGSSVSVSITLSALQSIINSVSNFNVEDAFSLSVTKYDNSFVDNLNIKLNGNTIKTVSNYTSGQNINFTNAELLTTYNALLTNNTQTFTFELITTDNGTEVGRDIDTATGTAKGTTRININGAWKRGIVWINVDGTWKRALMIINSSGTWKRGI